MKLLFVKAALAWPRSSGHDVHTFYAMRACTDLGHEIGLMTSTATTPEATTGLRLTYSARLSGEPPSAADPIRLSSIQERFRSYWGVDTSSIAALRQGVRAYRPDAVVVVGLDALPFLAGTEHALRIWYAADEWIWHHLSLVQPAVPATYGHVRVAALKGLYERAYAPIIDRAWVVSQTECRAMRWLAGVRHVDIVPNGVDAEHYAPVPSTVAQPRTAVFWGRLDFEPNVQGLQWFVRSVWPALRRAVPDARFTILGFKPTAEALALGTIDGVQVKPDLPDLREEARRCAVVVLPFVSGGGIKNKLLEAAALGLPIVCSPRALNGLRHPSTEALITASSPDQWVQALTQLWSREDLRQRAGAAARRWVIANHSWRVGVEPALAALAAMRQRGDGS